MTLFLQDYGYNASGHYSEVSPEAFSCPSEANEALKNYLNYFILLLKSIKMWIIFSPVSLKNTVLKTCFPGKIKESIRLL